MALKAGYKGIKKKYADAINNGEGGGGGGGGGVINYSTDEQKTGVKWIDGRDVYQKTFIFTGIAGVSTYRSEKLNLDIDLAIEATGRIKLGTSGGNNWCTAPYIETPSYYCGLTYQGGSNDCIVCSAGNWGLTDAEVTLKYVKRSS